MVARESVPKDKSAVKVLIKPLLALCLLMSHVTFSHENVMEMWIGTKQSRRQENWYTYSKELWHPSGGTHRSH